MTGTAAATGTPNAPTRPLRVTITQPLKAAQKLWRVHDRRFNADAFFNGIGPGINPTRFAPARDAAGAPIDVLYAGLKRPGALFETVFHDVPPTGLRTAHAARLKGRVLTCLHLRTRLTLADLTKLGLGSLGTTRVQLIESGPLHYATTAMWSEAVHQDNGSTQGLFWISRQNDRHAAVMLYGDRVPRGGLQASTSHLELWHGQGLDFVAHWAARAGITLI